VLQIRTRASARLGRACHIRGATGSTNYGPTLMISTSWSTPESPGNSGWPSSSSAMTHPTDHTSIAGE
jgi:hypothetical protein